MIESPKLNKNIIKKEDSIKIESSIAKSIRIIAPSDTKTWPEAEEYPPEIR